MGLPRPCPWGGKGVDALLPAILVVVKSLRSIAIGIMYIYIMNTSCTQITPQIVWFRIVVWIWKVLRYRCWNVSTGTSGSLQLWRWCFKRLMLTSLKNDWWKGMHATQLRFRQRFHSVFSFPYGYYFPHKTSIRVTRELLMRRTTCNLILKLGNTLWKLFLNK